MALLVVPGRKRWCRPAMAAMFLVIVVWPGNSRSADVPLPSVVERYLALMKPSTSERRRLLAGEPVAKLLDTQVAEQVSVLGAIWIDVPVRQYLDALRRIETWETGRGFFVTRRVSQPPRLDDFAELRLTPAFVADLRACRVGDCKAKFDERGIDAIRRGIDWSSPERHAAAERLMRQIVLDYGAAYLAGGNERMPLLRDKETPVAMGDEFRGLLEELPALSPRLQQLRSLLLQDPRVPQPGAESFLYWQETEFGLKRTIRLSHMTLLDGERESAVASKMVYASHYFRAAVELRALVPDPQRGPGFWFVTITASRTDGMTGLTGLFVRYRVRSEARAGVASMMAGAKRRLEAAR